MWNRGKEERVGLISCQQSNKRWSRILLYWWCAFSGYDPWNQSIYWHHQTLTRLNTYILFICSPHCISPGSLKPPQYSCGSISGWFPGSEFQEPTASLLSSSSLQSRGSDALPLTPRFVISPQCRELRMARGAPAIPDKPLHAREDSAHKLRNATHFISLSL